MNMSDIIYSPYLNLNRFDLQLEDFGLDTTALQAVKTTQVFRAWDEDWEEEVWYDNDVVALNAIVQKVQGIILP